MKTGKRSHILKTSRRLQQLATLSLFCLSPALAQESEQQALTTPLIFDPVLLEYASPDAEDREVYQVRELTTLPSRRDNNTEPDMQSLSLSVSEAFRETPAQYQEVIDSLEIEGGVYEQQLSEAYLSLGSIYQQLDEHELAIEAFDNALHISRINNGLYNEGQLNIVSELVESYLSIGDFMAANQQQEYLFFVQQKLYGPDHPVHLAKLLEYADWNLHAASLSMGYIPNIEALGLRPVPQGNQSLIRSIRNFDNQAAAHLFLASNAYYQILRLQRTREQISLNQDTDSLQQIRSDLDLNDSDLDIPEAEKKLAFTHFLLAEAFENVPQTANMFDTDRFMMNFSDGQNALERRLSYLQSSGGSSLDIISALVDIADWFLIFERWTSAEEIYAQVLELMESNNISQIPGLAYPDLPVAVPSYISTFYSRESNNIAPDEVLDYEGYIDVRFSLSRYGSPSRVDVLNRTPNTLEDTERALMRMLRRTKFRLQLEQTEEDREEYSENDYMLRYYYTAQPQPDEDEE
ncbi:MAG: hypothetical protein CMQ38_02580 [Gammaproteobacteria bacterium]|nr:hypothetical protein [Gammaproteobacteria bacterium]